MCARIGVERLPQPVAYALWPVTCGPCTATMPSALPVSTSEERFAPACALAMASAIKQLGGGGGEGTDGVFAELVAALWSALY